MMSGPLYSKKKKSAKLLKTKKTKNNWEDVPVNEEFFSDKEFANLISLEVLTDYHLTNNGRHTLPKTEKDPKSASKKSHSDYGKVLTKSKEESLNKMLKQKSKRKSKSSAESREGDHDHQDSIPTKRQRKQKEMHSNVSATSSWTVADAEKDNQKEAQSVNATDQVIKKKKKKTKKKAINMVDVNIIDDITTNTIATSSSPTFDLGSWSSLGVREVITRALSEAAFDTPTPIQKLTLGASLLGKKDVVGAAETGSGKTLAFAIPILQGIIDNKEKDDSNSNELQALILTPTRELALQIKKHMDVVSKYTNIKVVNIVGGLALAKQERLLRMKPEVIIATIGRFWELLESGNSHLCNLQNIKFLAIDETDRMVEKGHFQELEGILGVLNQNPSARCQRQNFVFSATLAFAHEPPRRLYKNTKRFVDKNKVKVSSQEKLREIMEMVGIVEKEAKIVDITTGKGTCETLVEMSLTCPLNEKDSYLYYFLVTHLGRTIVFCNSINCVRRLVNLFVLLKLKSIALHSEMVQKQRLKSLERFAANEKGILIATDVAARGLDITNIEHVIHYQVPKTAESYIHRSGRTARAFKGGLALVLIEPSETTSFWNISRSLGREELLPTFPVDVQILHQLKSRVSLAIKVESLEHQFRKKSADINWVEKAKKEMDLASSDEDSDSETDGKKLTKKNLNKSKAELLLWKGRLENLLASNIGLLQQSQRVSDAYDKLMNQSN